MLMLMFYTAKRVWGRIDPPKNCSYKMCKKKCSKRLMTHPAPSIWSNQMPLLQSYSLLTN